MWLCLQRASKTNSLPLVAPATYWNDNNTAGSQVPPQNVITPVQNMAVNMSTGSNMNVNMGLNTGSVPQNRNFSAESHNSSNNSENNNNNSAFKPNHQREANLLRG